MVLAIECDGATHHASAIWSTDWFRNRDAEIGRATAAYGAAVAAADRAAAPTPTPAAAPTPAPEGTAPAPAAPPAATGARRGPRPRFVSSAGVPIDEYAPEQLVALIRWIESDTLLRTEEELLDDAMQELGYERRGPRIVAALTAAIHEARRDVRRSSP
jgi:hypothetical protein